MYKILIVEDDEKISLLIKEKLEKWGFQSEYATDLKNVMKTVLEFKPNLILLDINLPFFDGFYWCGEIRKISNIPVIFISSRDSKMDILMAMNMGGDDFIQKPFSMDILVAKVKALLRRTYSYNDNSLSVIERNSVMLNVNERCLYYKKSKIELTANEFRIMFILFNSAGKLVTREKLMQGLWQDESFVDDNTLTVNINRLRKKLLQHGIDNFITTERGEGYSIK